MQLQSVEILAREIKELKEKVALLEAKVTSLENKALVYGPVTNNFRYTEAVTSDKVIKI